MSNNFGFSFGFNPRDDDDNNNPLGGLGDMLNQFGQMLSGLGSSMNSPDAQESVNYSLAERISRQQIGSVTPISDHDRRSVEDTVRLAELWLDDATYLPASGNKAVAWNAEDWLTATLPMWKRMVTPVATQMNKANMESMPEEAREMMGPLTGMLTQMASMSFGMQLGNALGDLATQSLSGSDFGIQVAPTNTTAILPQSVARIADETGISPQDILVYISAREAARQRLFQHVPWLVERLVSSVEEYALGLELDTSAIEEAMRSLNLDSQDPSEIQSAVDELQNLDLKPTIRSRNAGATSRLETLLALVEGWVEYVVTEAMGERVPSTIRLNEAWRRRRNSGGSAEQAFATVVGIEFAAPKVTEAIELWRRVTVAVGPERRDKVWDHPDFLPAAEHLDNSADFIDSLLDDAENSGFDPIAEITALEEMLSQESQKAEEATGAESASTDSEDTEPDATSGTDAAADNTTEQENGDDQNQK